MVWKSAWVKSARVKLILQLLEQARGASASPPLISYYRDQWPARSPTGTSAFGISFGLRRTSFSPSINESRDAGESFGIRSKLPDEEISIYCQEHQRQLVELIRSSIPSSPKNSLDLAPRSRRALGKGPKTSMSCASRSSSAVHVPFREAVPGNERWHFTN